MQNNNPECSEMKYPAKVSCLELSIAKKHELEDILANPIAYIFDDRFDCPSTMSAIEQRQIDVLPGVTLSLEDEQALFLQLNYARHKMGQIQQKLLSGAKWRKSEVLELLRWNQKQLDSRSKIVTSNMGLVLSMVKRVNYHGVEFTDLVSEGSMALMRATEKFDCHRGFKFSTYACQAISKSFLRAAKKSYRYRSLFPAQLESAMEKSDHLQQTREAAHQDRTEEVCAILRDNLADLSATEQSVLEMRFSLNQEYSKPLTLKQVGYKLDLSKERIRQIQKSALAKIRQVAERRMFASW